MSMEFEDLTHEILRAAMKDHTALGPGRLESADRDCPLFELHRSGLAARKEVELPVIYDGVRIDVGYRLDLLVEDKVIVEIKPIDQLAGIHEAQLITYLKLSNTPTGLLTSFNVLSLKDGIKRLVGPAISNITP